MTFKLITLLTVTMLSAQEVPGSAGISESNWGNGFLSNKPPLTKIDFTDNFGLLGEIDSKLFKKWFGNKSSGYLIEFSSYKASQDHPYSGNRKYILVQPGKVESSTLALSRIYEGIYEPDSQWLPVQSMPDPERTISFKLSMTTSRQGISLSLSYLSNFIRATFSYIPLLPLRDKLLIKLEGETHGLIDGESIEITLSSSVNSSIIGPQTSISCFIPGNTRVFMSSSDDGNALVIPRKTRSRPVERILDLGLQPTDEHEPQLRNIVLDFTSLGIGGLDSQLDEVVTAVITRTMSQSVLDKIGITGHEKGILLYGPPGTGKTLIARELSRMLGVDDKHFQIIGGAQLLSKYVGESEENLRRMFETAKQRPKELFVYFFDEIDSIAAVRSSGGGAGDKVGNNMVNKLLTVMDGAKKINNILIIAATNRLDILDPALLRPGRFGVKLHIGLPDSDGRRDIFNIHLKSNMESKSIDSDLDLAWLVESTENFTGAEIKGLCDKARQLALRSAVKDPKDIKSLDESKLVLSKVHFIEAFNTITPAFGQNPSLFSKLLSEHDLVIPHQKRMTESVRNRIDSMLHGKVLSVMIHGDHASGKTAVAGIIADQTRKNFDMTRIITPAFMKLSFADQLEKAWQDSQNVDSALIILDRLEDLLGLLNEYKYDERAVRALNTLLNARSSNKVVVVATLGNEGKMLLEHLNKSMRWGMALETQKLSVDDYKSIAVQKGASYPDIGVSLNLGDYLEFINVGDKDLEENDWSKRLALFQ